MTASSKTVRGAVALASMGLFLVLGCGDSTGLSKRYPVSGTVNYGGKPVEKGTISFVPTAPDGRAATGEISGGSYSLTTAEPGDGALPGSYKVTVLAKEMDTTKLREIAKGGQFHHDEHFAKALKNAKPLVPSKYSTVETSGLTAEVKNSSNKLNFDLVD